MNSKEAIEVLHTVSDILLELNDQFDIEIMFNYDFILNIESNYDKIINILSDEKFINGFKKLEFRIITKRRFNNFDVAYQRRNKPGYIMMKKMIAKSASFIMDKLDVLLGRLSSMLNQNGLQYEAHEEYSFLLMSSQAGSIQLPLRERDISKIFTTKHNIDLIKLRELNISSYEKNKNEVDNHKDIQLNYAYVIFEVSKIEPVKKTFKDRIRKFIDFL